MHGYSIDEVGKYLGHYIVQNGRERGRHKDLWKGIQRQIDGWKLNCSSRAGSLTLAQLVLGIIPIFFMQLEWLPAWLHKKLDKAMRRCVWGNAEGRKGYIYSTRKCYANLRRLEEPTSRWLKT